MDSMTRRWFADHLAGLAPKMINLSCSRDADPMIRGFPDISIECSWEFVRRRIESLSPSCSVVPPRNCSLSTFCYTLQLTESSLSEALRSIFFSPTVTQTRTDLIQALHFGTGPMGIANIVIGLELLQARHDVATNLSRAAAKVTESVFAWHSAAVDRVISRITIQSHVVTSPTVSAGVKHDVASQSAAKPASVGGLVIADHQGQAVSAPHTSISAHPRGSNPKAPTPTSIVSVSNSSAQATHQRSPVRIPKRAKVAAQSHKGSDAPRVAHVDGKKSLDRLDVTPSTHDGHDVQKSHPPTLSWV